MMSNEFWKYLDNLLSSHDIFIDRPRNSAHPKYPDMIYPVDYGYLIGTKSSDGEGIDVWLGSNGDSIDAIICVVDILKKETETKILIGCTTEEKEMILKFHNQTSGMKGIMVER